jgi:hypothetical protein
MFDKLNPFADQGSEERSAASSGPVLDPPPQLVPPADAVEAPVSPEAIGVVRQQMQADQSVPELDLPLILSQVQSWVENHDYPDRQGNSFLEEMLDDFNDQSTLRKLVAVLESDGRAEVMFVLGAEGWRDRIGPALDLSEDEIMAARDAHQRYAEELGLAEYAAHICVLTVSVDLSVGQWLLSETQEAPEMTDLLPSADPTVDHPTSDEGASGPSDSPTQDDGSEDARRRPVRAGGETGSWPDGLLEEDEQPPTDS